MTLIFIALIIASILIFSGMYQCLNSTSDVIKVKVIKSRIPTYWYADKIGQIFLVKNNYEYTSYELVDRGAFIQKEDCTVIH